MATKLSSKIVTFSTDLIRKHLQWIHGITTTRPVTAFVACCLVFILSSISISRINFEADIFKLFPQKGPLALFLDTIKWTGSAGNAYFLLEGEKEQLIREAELFAGKLRSLSIEGSPAFSKVKYRVYDPEEAKSFAGFIGYAVTRPQLFVAPSDTARYRQLLSPESVTSSLAKAKTELANPASVTDLIIADPLYLRDLVVPRLKEASQALDLDRTSPYFLSRDGKVLIIIAEPSRPISDMAFARKLVEAINQARKGAGVKISCTGAHLSAVTDEAVIKKNVIVAVLSSLAVVLAIFYGTYRRFLPTMLIPLILVFAVVLAVGAGGLIFPELSIISLAFTSLIIGLGTDHPIHLYDRFHFERSQGRSSAEALRLATVDTGHALFTSATTTAFPFLGLVVADVRVLAELGLLVGLGVIFSLYATLFFLPPLLLLMEKRFPLQEYRPLPVFRLGAIWDAGRRRWQLNIALSLLVVLGLLLAASSISFESELKNLQPRSSEAFLTQEKVEQHLSISPKQLIVAVEGQDLNQVLARGNRIEELARQLRQRGEIVSFSSLGQVINDEADQVRVIADLAPGSDGSDPGLILKTSLERQGFSLEPFREYHQRLSGLAHARILPVSEGLAHLANSPFRGIVERLMIHTASGYHLLTYLNYRGAEFRQAAFLDALHTVDPLARSTSVDLISRQLTDSVRQSFARALVFGGVLVLLLLVSHFNSPTGIFYSLFPVFAGLISMLGLMALCDMRLNFMNVMVLVTIIGMGSDYGLHVAHRVRNCPEGEFKGRFVQSGRAVLISALTNIVGFGSLAFIDYGALASIGWATNFGVVAITALTLITLPAFMRRLGENEKPLSG